MMMGPQSRPIIVLKDTTKRSSGRTVQFGNIQAAKSIADVIRTCLGPRSMLKMLMDPMGGIVMTNDGNAILREITVEHPAAKSMIEISRTQDEEVGDGTTSVIVLAGEFLSQAKPLLEQNLHPTVIIWSFRQALEDMIKIVNDELSTPVDPDNADEMKKVIGSCIGTKMISSWSDMGISLAYQAVKTVAITEPGGRKEIDVKRYARVEKIPGGSIGDSMVLDGVMLNKDVTHAKMARRIENPRVLLLDSNLEYKKGESQTDFEIVGEKDFTRMLQIEEEQVRKMCDDIVQFKPTLVITEKGVSDLAQHFLMKAGISVLRRVKKSDNIRIARAVGARIVNRTDEIREDDIGTGSGLFEVRKLGDEYFSFIYKCREPKACTLVLRGASKDVLNEVERNLHDAMAVARNVMLEPLLCAGGGALEMAVSQKLRERAKSVSGVRQYPYLAVANALEVIPRTLVQNCGANTIRTITALRAKHATPGNETWGIDGTTGELVDMKEYGVWEPAMVKTQTFKTAIETAILLLRIDDIVSGTKKSSELEASSGPAIQDARPSDESMKDD